MKYSKNILPRVLKDGKVLINCPRPLIVRRPTSSKDQSTALYIKFAGVSYLVPMADEAKSNITSDTKVLKLKNIIFAFSGDFIIFLKITSA